MKNSIPPLRGFLWTFSGEDKGIIQQSSNQAQWAFSYIGLLVIFIFLGCWISASSFMGELLEGSSKWVSIPIGILWALIITNMYLLLLYTISPTLLPVAKKKKGKGSVRLVVTENYSSKIIKNLVNISIVLRLIFISALAFIIAQPLNVLIFSKQIAPILENYKAEYRINMLILADSALIQLEVENHKLFIQNIRLKVDRNDSLVIRNNINLLEKKVDDDVQFLNNSQTILRRLKQEDSISKLNRDQQSDSLHLVLSGLIAKELSSDSSFLNNIDNLMFNNSVLRVDFEEYKSNLSKIISAKIKNYHTLNSLLAKSNFYIKKMQILLSSTINGFIVSILICGLFLYPIYRKYKIRKEGDFYEKKKKIEHAFVLDKYQNFKNDYSKLFNEKIDIFNNKTISYINMKLQYLKTFDPKRYNIIQKNIHKSLLYNEIIKFEYWADPPFRTKRHPPKYDFKTEEDLLNSIYTEEE